MRWAISGGAGFLGLHLARRLLADGHEVRTLDVVPLDDPALEASAEELRGDVRDPADARELTDGADVLVHAAAALPIQASREAIRSVNVEGTAVTLAAALEAGVRRAILISSTAVYGIPKVHPISEHAPLVGVGHYGESKIEAEQVAQDFARRGLEVVIIRPKTFLGPERLGVFEILFDWIREGRRIPILGDGSNRYQLLAVEDLVAATLAAASADVAGETFNVGATEFGTVRSDLEALIAHAGPASRLLPAALERAGALRDLRLVPGAPRADAGRRRHAPRPVGPARARSPEENQLVEPGDVRPGDVAPGDVRPGDVRPGDGRPGRDRPERTVPAVGPRGQVPGGRDLGRVAPRDVVEDDTRAERIRHEEAVEGPVRVRRGGGRRGGRKVDLADAGAGRVHLPQRQRAEHQRSLDLVGRQVRMEREHVGGDS